MAQLAVCVTAAHAAAPLQAEPLCATFTQQCKWKSHTYLLEAEGVQRPALLVCSAGKNRKLLWLAALLPRPNINGDVGLALVCLDAEPQGACSLEETLGMAHCKFKQRSSRPGGAEERWTSQTDCWLSNELDV
mgnify:CR=1 FL=1